MSGRQVDEVDVLEVQHLGEHRVTRFGRLHDPRCRNRAAHQSGRDRQTRVVGEFHAPAQHRTGAPALP
ncbi:hypothetical protein Y710_00055 [Gordonia sp. QH-12]|nr:hypothetical protein Y710_00055 [Gordonia sp. QH-12]